MIFSSGVVQMLGLSQPGNVSKFRSMHGSQIKFSCDKTLVVSKQIYTVSFLPKRWSNYKLDCGRACGNKCMDKLIS